jgi:hypothetical protein
MLHDLLMQSWEGITLVTFFGGIFVWLLLEVTDQELPGIRKFLERLFEKFTKK